MILYISGPMTGYANYNFQAFHHAANKLRKQGYKVISPAEIEQPVKTWEGCMRQDLKEMLNADIIAVLEGWEKSKGARIEVELASKLGMEIIDAYTMKRVKAKTIDFLTEINE